MVVPSPHRGSTCENGISTSLSTGNGVSERRTSRRLQKLQSQKAVPVCYKEDPVDNIEERVGRKKAKVGKQRNQNSTSVVEPIVVDNKTREDNDVVFGPKNDGCHVAAMSVGLTEVAETSAKGEKSAYALVTDTLRTFNKHYLLCVQEEERRGQQAEAHRKTTKGSNCEKGNAPEKNISRRPDLKAIKQMRQTNAVLYPKKQIGSIPGIDIGHQFFSRAEMVVVGFHSHWLNGIDYIGETAKKDYPHYTLPVAIVIVISGQYEDDLDNCEDVVYTGQGGNDLLGRKHQINDQVMRGGNLGLKNCMKQNVPIRVVRGHQSKSSYVGKVYTYDGLYQVVDYWAEKGISGYTVYKFQLKRFKGQPLLTTSQVQFINGRIPNSISEIRGLVCKDISGGQEDIPIPATNLVDDPPVAPTGYKYFTRLQLAKGLRLPKNLSAPGCGCKDGCIDPNRCACAKLNGSDFPYVYMKRFGGRLVEPKDIVFECGPNCGCPPECVNRTSQRGIRFRLEVFKTPNKGWGVRSWDPIPSGSPVCEYIGVLRKTDELDSAVENYYVFDIDCLQTMKGLDGRQRRLRDVSIPAHMDETGDDKSESIPEFCIDAFSSGNVTRYINHSCQPNLFVQCVLSEHHNIKLARIVLFAADNIPPLQELSYDYAYDVDSVVGPDGKTRRIACYCGAPDCRKRLL
ncbi:histone-lysine N-methyltransferase, H3 lysine-9 specific SUVH4-like [Rhododendron vialii]|uniref:histone-lysine N-methyltransferase, H3 lysine-9 specific SUVH4-like n=1 Tax=Rhododendron vialii TaxID=182163 RepID=UPI00266038C6|nr:histone-lysine N-methyltransferase, H3 lysine-9 specific SUVH4-like [Rhododendron vialii]